MFPQPTRQRAVLAAATLGLAVLVGLASIGLRAGEARAQPQGIMSVPACQCSAPTLVQGLSTRLVHCMCGAATCVLSQHEAKGADANMLQCIR